MLDTGVVLSRGVCICVCGEEIMKGRVSQRHIANMGRADFCESAWIEIKRSGAVVEF